MGLGRSRYVGGYAAPTSPYMSSMAPYGATGFPLAGSPLMGTSPYMGASPYMASTPFMSSNYPYMSSTMSPLLISSYGSPLSYGGYSGYGGLGYGGLGGMACGGYC